MTDQGLRDAMRKLGETMAEARAHLDFAQQEAKEAALTIAECTRGIAAIKAVLYDRGAAPDPADLGAEPTNTDLEDLES